MKLDNEINYYNRIALYTKKDNVYYMRVYKKCVLPPSVMDYVNYTLREPEPSTFNYSWTYKPNDSKGIWLNNDNPNDNI